MSRTYNEWTEEDIDKLKRGIIPENHPHHAACHIKAKQLGFTFHKAKIVDEKWTPKQIDQLRSGILPKGKSWNEAVKVAAFHNIDFENIYKTKPLTADEVKLVNSGVIPPHREKADVIKFAASELSRKSPSMQSRKAKNSTRNLSSPLTRSKLSPNATV